MSRCKRETDEDIEYIEWARTVEKGWRWNADEAAKLKRAESDLVNAVFEMICVNPLQQTTEERRAVVAYLDAMTAEIRGATH